MQQIIKKIPLYMLVLGSPFIMWGATAADMTSATTVMNIDLNTMLVCFAILLLLPLYYTGKTFLYSAKYFLDKKKTDQKIEKVLSILILILFLSNSVFSQTNTTTNNDPVSNPTNWITVTLSIIIVLEFIFIIYFSFQTGLFLNPKKQKAGLHPVEAEKSWFQLFWEKINSFKPISEEASIDTGHSYDGIRELDNITPPWFIAGFVASIIFAISYLFIYHVAKMAPLPREEYAMDVAKAETEKAKYLAMQGNNVDETTVKMLGEADIAAGKSIFTEKCTTCHGPTGGSMPGGVGPNLTDAYWIHGGSINNIFKTIKYGWPEKGMISWKDQFSPMQIAQLASYVKSLAGSNPPNAKDPQGDLYSESAVNTPTDSIATDSMKKKTQTDSVQLIK